MKVVFIFIDGLGIGKQNRDTNPCAHDETGIFRIFQEQKKSVLPFDGQATGLDATLGIVGLPQSATGQTALFTGINAAALIGRHLSGFPNQALRQILLNHSVLLQVKQLGKRAAFINAFRPLFFSLPEELILRLSATTIANYAAGLPFFGIEDIFTRRSIYQDFTNNDLRERGFKLPIFSPEGAADILATAADNYDFLLYEYFKTDQAGHTQEMSRAVAELQKLGQFLLRLLSKVDLKQTVVIVSSDHGNIEDLSTKSHTTNPAMTMIWGEYRGESFRRLSAIHEMTPFILSQICVT